MIRVDPKTQMLLDLMASLGEPPYESMTAAEFRERRARGRDLINTPPPALTLVEEAMVNGAESALKARIYDSQKGADRPTLVYFHGGGFVYGDLDSHDGLCRRLAAAGGFRVIAVDYRLAPEHPFPAAPMDAIAALGDIIANASKFGVDPSRIAVGGDSAGACLATVAARDAARKRATSLRFQLLFYPVVQQNETPSRRKFAQGYFLTQDAMEWFDRCYAGAWRGGADERLSPLAFATPERLAPALIVTAGFDPLCDEGVAYAEKLSRDGVSVRHVDYADQIHGFCSFTAFSSAAEEAIAEAARAVAAALCA